MFTFNYLTFTNTKVPGDYQKKNSAFTKPPTNKKTDLLMHIQSEHHNLQINDASSSGDGVGVFESPYIIPLFLQ